ncbi:MAG: GNVR domain-containing protein [Candidatus Acidiferrum sp.]
MGQAGTKRTEEQEQQAVVGLSDALAKPELSGLEKQWLGAPRLFWECRKFLRKSLAVGLCLGLLVAFLIPVRYESTVQLMPPDNQSSSGMAMLAALSAKNAGTFGNLAGDFLGLKGSGALFVGILRSQTVADRLIDRFDLQKVYSLRLKEDARRKLMENTSVSEDRKSGIVSITTTDHDRLRAAALAQAYAEELDRLVAELSTSAARRERMFLEERLVTVKQDLDEASRDFGQFASKNTAIDIKEQGRAMVEAAALLQGQLIADEAELKGLQEIYTSNNIRVKSTAARIAELKNQLAKLGGTTGKPTRNVSTGDPAQTSDLVYPTIRKLPLLGITYADLYRRTKIEEALYETLTQQYELAKVEEVRETPSVKVLDQAQIPGRKSFPPRTLIIIVCVLLSLAAAMAWELLHQYWLAVPANHPNKALGEEIFRSVDAMMPWAPPNGSWVGAFSHRIWTKYISRNGSGDSPE